MPDVKCGDCGGGRWFADREVAKAWELKHHQESFQKAEPGSLLEAAGFEGLHNCRAFGEHSDMTGLLARIRIYNYGRLVEEQILKEDY